MNRTLGFACHWGADRALTWSGTPLRLSAALGDLSPVADIDVTLPPQLQRLLKVSNARRSGGQWHSKWRHGRTSGLAIERRLRSAVAATRPDYVLEIQDLGIVDRPFAVLQDLSYDLLLDQFGPGGVPHFQTLSRERVVRLRDRQHEIYGAADALLPMSRWLADRNIKGGVAPERVHVVHPGVNVPLDPALPLAPRRQGEVSRLLFVGRDFDTKAGDQVVAAFELLRSELGRKVTLTIAGPKSWPMAGPPPAGVEFLGPVPSVAVQSLYDSHDLFVMPSRFEGFGIAFIEALVRGLPCIGRNACAMPEIITPGDGGLLVQREDPAELATTIIAALEDDQLYESCARAAPQRRQYYTWARAAEQILAAIGFDPHSTGAK